MVDYCTIVMLADERILTDYYIKDEKSALKRRLLGLVSNYDSMPISAINNIIKKSGKVYMYNSFKEISKFKLGMQEIVDMGADLDKIVCVEPENSKIRLTRLSNTKTKDRFIDKLFDDAVFNISPERQLRMDILKYLAASFRRFMAG